MSDLTVSADGGTAPARIGKYEVRGELGRGSCGVVYKGFDPFVQREVAIKVALPRGPVAGGTGTGQGAAFFAEARAAGMLQHPHIIATFDAGIEGEINYIVMEHIDGETLQALCRPQGPRAGFEQVLDIGFKCARALDYAHARGVLHRDIKPSNIMLTRDGVPKLMDFSIAEITGGAKSAARGVLGSPLYMSPEQVRGAALGPTSDLYALGAVLFQLLTGEPPFRAADMATLFEQIRGTPAPRIEAFRPEAPRGLGDAVARLLLKDPQQRFQSGRELAGVLTRLFDQLSAGDRQITRRESQDSLRRLHFFAGFSDDEIDEILNASSLLTYAAGQAIIEEGALDNACYIIALGRAEVRKGGKLLHTLEKGDCFGEIGFLGAARRSATVTAATQVLALRVNAALMDQVSRDCQLRFYKVFTEALIYRLALTSARLSSITAA